jgi:hypothetical protein
MLVSALTGQVINFVVLAAGVRSGQLPIPKLPRTHAQMVAQFALLRIHVRVRLVMVNRQGFQGSPRANLGGVSCFYDNTFQFVP